MALVAALHMRFATLLQKQASDFDSSAVHLTRHCFNLSELGYSNVQHGSVDYSYCGHLIQYCTDNKLVRQAKQLHASLVQSSTVLDNFLASKLITFYSTTDCLRQARKVFDQIPYKNTFSWNALLMGYSLNNHPTEALDQFSSFLRSDPDTGCVKPDNFTITCVLKALSAVCTSSLLAKMIHGYVTKNGFDVDVFVGNGLISFYSRCDDMESARGMFEKMSRRDVVSWNSMIAGYSQGGFHDECKNLYLQMSSLVDFKPDGVTVLSILQSCAQSNDLLFGMEVHRYVIENEIKMDISICNAVIALYAKCGSLDYARELFKEMSEKDDITYGAIISGYMAHGFVTEAIGIFRDICNPGISVWNAVISGQVQNNHVEGVLDLVRKMQFAGLKPNCVTLSSTLPVISYFSNLKGGKEIHAYAVRNNCDRNIYVATAIIDMYGKLGALLGAQRVFGQAKGMNVIVWTAIISASADHGDASLALTLFDEMQALGIQPDPITITAVLSACAHAGLVNKAMEIFDSLFPKYGIEPLVEHYACIVGVLSRARRLSEAVKFINEMPIEPNAKVWGALLVGASVSGDVVLGKFVCNHLFAIEPENTGNYVIMANLYSKAGRWEEAEEVRERMNAVGLRKVAGMSWIESCGGFESFTAKDVSNERADEIYEILNVLFKLLREEECLDLDELD